MLLLGEQPTESTKISPCSINNCENHSRRDRADSGCLDQRGCGCYSVRHPECALGTGEPAARVTEAPVGVLCGLAKCYSIMNYEYADRSRPLATWRIPLSLHGSSVSNPFGLLMGRPSCFNDNVHTERRAAAPGPLSGLELLPTPHSCAHHHRCQNRTPKWRAAVRPAAGRCGPRRLTP